MKVLSTVILIILVSASYAQPFVYPSIKSTGRTLYDFVPPGWNIIDSAYGDLNKDYLTDYVLILQHKDSVQMVNDLRDTVLTQPRILVVLFKKDTSDVLFLAEQSNTFILKNDNPSIEDPYQELAINKGVLEITFNIFQNMGGWTVVNVVYTFRYQQKQFTLVGADYSTFNRASHDSQDYSYNFLTKKRSLTTRDGESEAKKTTWKRLSVPVLKTLKTFKQPFTWEVDKDVTL